AILAAILLAPLAASDARAVWGNHTVASMGGSGDNGVLEAVILRGPSPDLWLLWEFSLAPSGGRLAARHVSLDGETGVYIEPISPSWPPPDGLDASGALMFVVTVNGNVSGQDLALS